MQINWVLYLRVFCIWKYLKGLKFVKIVKNAFDEILKTDKHTLQKNDCKTQNNLKLV